MKPFLETLIVAILMVISIQLSRPAQVPPLPWGTAPYPGFSITGGGDQFTETKGQADVSARYEDDALTVNITSTNTAATSVLPVWPNHDSSSNRKPGIRFKIAWSCMKQLATGDWYPVSRRSTYSENTVVRRAGYPGISC